MLVLIRRLFVLVTQLKKQQRVWTITRQDSVMNRLANRLKKYSITRFLMLITTSLYQYNKTK
uniref:Uncharacterized protein n=1 Tax=uncultured marine virus TaxID=186617 RepID=A0A0F7L0I4_9VIRU|nr:hypothetical protein [uncultured marine virus]